MPIRLKHRPHDNDTGETTDPVTFEATYNDYTYTFGPGETRSFPDDGVGVGVIAAFNGLASGYVAEDDTHTNMKEVNTAPSRS